jgi:hypothetical protein
MMMKIKPFMSSIKQVEIHEEEEEESRACKHI